MFTVTSAAFIGLNVPMQQSMLCIVIYYIKPTLLSLPDRQKAFTGATTKTTNPHQ